VLLRRGVRRCALLALPLLARAPHVLLCGAGRVRRRLIRVTASLRVHLLGHRPGLIPAPRRLLGHGHRHGGRVIAHRLLRLRLLWLRLLLLLLGRLRRLLLGAGLLRGTGVGLLRCLVGLLRRLLLLLRRLWLLLLWLLWLLMLVWLLLLRRSVLGRLLRSLRVALLGRLLRPLPLGTPSSCLGSQQCLLRHLTRLRGVPQLSRNDPRLFPGPPLRSVLRACLRATPPAGRLLAPRGLLGGLLRRTVRWLRSLRRTHRRAFPLETCGHGIKAQAPVRPLSR
jgi:hypothetical protein